MKINKKRIKDLVKRKSFKQKEIAVEIGVTPQDWNNWMFRGIFPHYNKLEILADILEVDVNSLLSSEEISEPAMTYNGHTFSVPLEDAIPFYDIDSQTNLSHFWKNESLIEPKDNVYLPGLKADFVFPFYGKGLEPQLVNGDWIGLRRITDTSFFNFGSLYAVVTKEQVMVRYIRQSEKENNVLLCAHDSFHDNIQLPIRSIKHLFMVVSIIKREII